MTMASAWSDFASRGGSAGAGHAAAERWPTANGTAVRLPRNCRRDATLEAHPRRELEGAGRGGGRRLAIDVGIHDVAVARGVERVERVEGLGAQAQRVAAAEL